MTMQGLQGSSIVAQSNNGGAATRPGAAGSKSVSFAKLDRVHHYRTSASLSPTPSSPDPSLHDSNKENDTAAVQVLSSGPAASALGPRTLKAQITDRVSAALAAVASHNAAKKDQATVRFIEGMLRNQAWRHR